MDNNLDYFLLFLLIFLLGFSLILILKNKKLSITESNLQKQVFKLSTNSLQKLTLSEKIIKGDFLKINSINKPEENKKTQLDLSTLNIIYYIGDFTCQSCFADFGKYLAHKNDKNNKVFCIIGRNNQQYLENYFKYFNINNSENLYVDINDLFIDFYDLYPVKIIFFDNGEIFSIQSEKNENLYHFGNDYLEFYHLVNRKIHIK